MAFVVGLTGGIGSGKSTVADAFADLGIDLVDADIVAREVVEPGRPALARIAEHFGSGILKEDGTLNRAILRKAVFADQNEKHWLESLLHPLIRQEILRQLNQASSPYALLVSPLLLETDQSQLVQKTVVVDVSVDTQLQRTLKRDGGDKQTISAIIDSQIDRSGRLAAADFVIDNEGDPDAISAQVQHIHTQLLALAAQNRNSAS